MGIADILRNGIASIDTITKDVQGDVQWEAWTGQNGYGTETFAAAVPLKAVIDTTRRQKTAPDGRTIDVVAALTILVPVVPNTAVTVPPRVQPIDPRDRITLPDGTTAPILAGPGSVWDTANARPFLNEITLGHTRPTAVV